MSKKNTNLETMTKEQLIELLGKGGVKVLPTIKGRAELPTKVKVGEYKGKATISLLKGDESFINKPFTFGKAKAQMIVENFEAIKKFAVEAKE